MRRLAARHGVQVVILENPPKFGIARVELVFLADDAVDFRSADAVFVA
jgi:hypothetical protein